MRRLARQLAALRHNGGMTCKESAELRALIDDRYGELVSRCHAAGVPLHDDAGVAERIRRTLLASDFAFEVWSASPNCCRPKAWRACARAMMRARASAR